MADTQAPDKASTGDEALSRAWRAAFFTIGRSVPSFVEFRAALRSVGWDVTRIVEGESVRLPIAEYRELIDRSAQLRERERRDQAQVESARREQIIWLERMLGQLGVDDPAGDIGRTRLRVAQDRRQAEADEKRASVRRELTEGAPQPEGYLRMGLPVSEPSKVRINAQPPVSFSGAPGMTMNEAELRRAADGPVVPATVWGRKPDTVAEPYSIVVTRDAPKASVLDRARELLTGRRQRVCPYCGAIGDRYTPEAEWQRRVAACGAEYDLTKRSYDEAVEAWRRNDR